MDKTAIEQELVKLKALQDVVHLEGVQLLINHAKNAVMNCIGILSSQYFEKSEQELRSLCATLKANLEIYQLMTGLKDEIEVLDSALKK
jgi:hypothetical protein